jgi:hypothetical protein
MKRSPFPVIEHRADFCVVGGGMPGLVAALTAARHGVKTVLMHDRPVLGGNASSEKRVHICGADVHNHYPYMRETGLLEEIRLDNLLVNPHKNFSVWDTVLYEKAHFQPNLELLLNCSCLNAEMDGKTIADVTGWQLTTQTYHKVNAKVFADCSGDAVLAPLTKAKFRMGREGRSEYGESIAPEKADERTMGMTCLFQAKEYDTPQPFVPPSWAYRFDKEEDLPYGAKGHHWWDMGYWWVELGGEQNSILDTERIRDELLRIVFGLWDHIKNRGNHGADNWAIDWIQFLPAKRESRRYIGEHVLTQLDVESEGRFEDIAAYGGWSMDDHHPAGFWAAKIGAPATIFHKAPSPYGIPYRALYSKNVANLMFAGRCASCTHSAMSSTRVMGTGISMAQAVGSAVAIAVKNSLTPKQVGDRVSELQQMILHDDAYIPWVPMDFGPLTKGAKLMASRGNPEALRDGTNRPVKQDMHCWECSPSDWTAYEFGRRASVEEVTLILDSAMEKNISMSHHQKDDQFTAIPDVVPKTFRLDGLENGDWRTVAKVEDNHQRFVRVPVHKELQGVRFVLDKTWGAERSNTYAFYVD